VARARAPVGSEQAGGHAASGLAGSKAGKGTDLELGRQSGKLAVNQTDSAAKVAAMFARGPSVFRTIEHHNYGVEFSPFVDGLLAVASSQYFGIVGNGKQFVLQRTPDGQMQLRRAFETQDGLFDCCWNEMNENQLVSASGDGSLKLWDCLSRDGFPIRNFHEHQQEAASVCWNLVAKNSFLSASWDSTVKLWNPLAPQSVRTFAEHVGSCYNARWAPRSATLFMTCSADATVKLFDVNQPRSVATIRAHEGEVLAVDWNKYNPNLFASGSVDRTLRVWDMRNAARPLQVLAGHQYAIRRLKCSPHDEHLIATVSYDMSACLWNTQREDALLMRAEHHTEFVMGVDFSLFQPGQLATCSWDEHVAVFNIRDGPPPRIPPPPKRPGAQGPPIK
jgi:peroxin-7